jgi:hypothetical protein
MEFPPHENLFAMRDCVMAYGNLHVSGQPEKNEGNEHD